jgi:hypothetical protein
MFWRLMHNLAVIFDDMFDRVCEKPLKTKKAQAQHVLLRGIGLRQHRC